MSFEFKTRAQQKLDYFAGLKRPLTDRESDELRRALHADYCYRRKHILERQREEEMELLDRLLTESAQPDAGERR